MPLDETTIKTIAVIGDNATRLQSHGGQSSEIKAFYEITPLAGIINRAGREATVTYAIGYDPHSTKPKSAGALPSATELADRAVAAARAADVVVFVGGLNHDLGNDCESRDRKDLILPYRQDELIQKIVAANPKTIVVLEGTMVEMDAWLDRVPALLQAWYPGMEGGNALARVLFGDVNPSGKLPATFPKRLADSPAHALGNYPGTNGTVTYAEGLLVGYRWFDTKQIEPLFPFGYGLSYTTFVYSNLKLVSGDSAGGPEVTVQFEIQNTGPRDGAEVAQVYVQQKNPSQLRPQNELKAFQKIFLKAGEERTVSVPLDRNAFAFYDPVKKGWVAERDDFQIHVGSSSRDMRLTGNFHRAAETFSK